MATSRLSIKDGVIVSFSDRYYESLSEDGKVYRGNGWEVKIKDGRKDRPGRIVCHAERQYSDGPAVCHREFKLADGTLGLAGGNIYRRYAYFRSERFQSFLSDHNISAVKKEDPNRIFHLRNAWHGQGTCSMDIRTDGVVEEIGYDSLRTEDWAKSNPGTGAYEGETVVRVSGATWAIEDTVQNERDNHNVSHILYTLVGDATKLVGIPNERKKKEWKKRIDSLVHSFDGTLELAPLEEALMKEFPGLEPKYSSQEASSEGIHLHERGLGYGFYDEALGRVAIDAEGEELERVCTMINASGVKTRTELDEFCRRNGLPVEPTRFYFTTHFTSSGDLWLTYKESTSQGKGFNRFNVEPWPTMKAPSFV